MGFPLLAGIDIGSPHPRGETRQSATGLEMVGGGEDIWGTRDEFHFAYVPVSGDVELSLLA